VTPIPVAGVILYRDGKVLLQLRDDKPDIVWPNTWAVFGGHIEPGEDPLAGAIRETEEELGLTLEPPLELVYHAEHGGRIRWFYAAPLVVDPDELTVYEGQRAGLFGEEELETLNIVPLHREILRGFFATRAM
jgi:8-oxo-dGTP diphosphatase